MTLPTITTPTFDLTLLTTGEKFRFRPFLVKEEKILVMAAESAEQEEMIRAMATIVTNCSDGKVDGDTLPFFELQNLFIKLRSKSIGEQTDFNLICGSCEHKIPYILDLALIEPVEFDGHSSTIMLTDEIGVKMRYPTAMEMQDKTTDTYDVILNCINTIFTADENTDATKEARAELVNFVDNLTIEQFEKIANFFVTMPKIEKRIDYKCPKCEEDNFILIDGVESFFE